MSTIQIRIDQKEKMKVKKILDELGLDFSSAVKSYFRQIIIKKGIPFKLLTENGITEAQERAILKASKEAKLGKNLVGPFNTEKEMKDYLNSIK